MSTKKWIFEKGISFYTLVVSLEISEWMSEKTQKLPNMITGAQIDEFCDFVLRQKQQGYTAKVSKDRIFQQREEIDRIDQPIEKYRSNMFYAISQTKQAIRFTNDVQTVFNSRDIYSDREAGAMTKNYAYDYDHEMRNVMDYYFGSDIDHFGVGVEACVGWNNDNKAPIFKRIHPRSIYPDPDGYGTINNFRFFGFDRTISKDELLKLNLRNIDLVEMRISSYENLIQDEEKENRGINAGYDANNELATIYHHYCKRGNKTVLVYMFEDILLDVVEITPISNLKTPKYWCPVILYYEDPDYRDPRGRSLRDTIEDKQRLETLLMNLFKIKTIRNVLGGKIFMDKNILNSNMDVLKRQTLQNQYYPVDVRDYSQPLSHLVYELPEQQVGQDFYNLLHTVQEKARQETHIDSQTQ